MAKRKGSGTSAIRISADDLKDPNCYRLNRRLDLIEGQIDGVADTANAAHDAANSAVETIGALPAPIPPIPPPDEIMAPNVTAAFTSITFIKTDHNTQAVFNYNLTFPTGDPDYAVHFNVVIVFAVDPAHPSGEIQIARFGQPATFTSGSTLACSSHSDAIIQTPVSQAGWKLRFKVYSENFTERPAPYTELTGITIPAVSITALSETDLTAARWVDINRSVYAPQRISIAFTNYPQTFTLWINTGSQNKWHGWYTVTGPTTFDIGLPGGREIVFGPVTNETWTPKAAPGTWDGNDALGWSETDLGLGPVAIASIPGIFSGSPITVAKMLLPLATNISALTVAAGVGGSFPYNLVDPDGNQFWSIPSISFDTTTAFLDPNTFTVNVTVQDLDGSGSPIGPEHIYGTPIVNNGLITMGPLQGPYGSVADPPRTGSIGKVRFKLSCCNRADQTTAAWSNPAAATLQTGIGSGAGHVDVLVAAGGAVPAGRIAGPRVLGNVPGADVATTALNTSSLTVATSDGITTIQIDPSRVVDINSPTTHESIKFTRSSISFAVTSPTLHVAEYGAGGIRANGSTWLTDTGDFVINRLIGFNQYFVAGMGLPPIIQAFGPQALGQFNAGVNNFIYIQRIGDAIFGAKNPIPVGLYRFTYSMSFLSGSGSGFAEVTIQSFDGLKNLIQSTLPLQASGFQAAATGSLIFYTDGTRDTQWVLQFVNTAGMAVVLTFALEKLT